MRQLTKAREKKLMGVAGGIADYLDMDKTVWRALWVFGCIVMPPLALAYLILGIVMPEAPYQAPAQPIIVDPAPVTDEQPAGFGESTFAAGETFGTGGGPNPQGEPVYSRNAYKPLTKSRNKWLSGVCGGVAEYFDVDPVLVRALWLVSVFFFGTGFLLYIILAILMPQSRPEYK